ncbi:MAG: ATP-binding cassette domain-containing protein [Pelolinea sp.]|jgi:signal transduction histidine kinase|nr:ATP-binding cassette domain-containing protein [Pelolinea sp.]
MQALLKVQQISKSFGTLPVIQNVNFSVNSGEVVGLTGSTGSGKSVLMMLLAGLYEPDSGQIYFKGKRLNWPFSAKNLGIGVIHQRSTLVEQFDVIGNIFLGNEIGHPDSMGILRRLDQHEMQDKAMQLLNRLDLKVNSLHEIVYNLSGEQRQMISIARVLTFPTSLIIIDEPTVSLSYPNQQKLLELIQDWRQNGVAVLFSSNNLDHLFAVTDRIIILQGGSIKADLHTDETNREEVVNYLLGTGKNQELAPSIWDFNSYDRVREYTEKLRYHQILLEKDLAAEGSLNRQLAEQLAAQLQALDQTNLALRDAQRRLLSEREEERKHLARELHDQIIQDLLSVNYDLEEIATRQTISTDLETDLATVRQSIRELVGNLRVICGTLRPPTIDSLGLGAALQSYLHDWHQRTGIDFSMNMDENLGRLPESIELSIFRIVQEGLNNVWRHAEASHVSVELRHTSPRTLMISIQDDGKGFLDAPDLTELSTQGHYGLMGISERVSLLGGRMHLENGKNNGSILMVEIPHPRVEAKPKKRRQEPTQK